jgi:two-component system response regulator PilR (NtrC family)
MKPEITALLVYDQAEPLGALQVTLEGQSVGTTRAVTCREASRLLWGANPPLLVFTDATLPDGSWAEVVALAARAPVPINVIVVGRGVDTRLYLEALEAGAYDFIAPPFSVTDLAYVVRCAADSASARREALTRAEQSPQKLLFSTSLASGLPASEEASIS